MALKTIFANVFVTSTLLKDSALSIIDPVTINFEIGDRNPAASKGLVDLAEEKEERSRTAEIQLQQVSVL